MRSQYDLRQDSGLDGRMLHAWHTAVVRRPQLIEKRRLNRVHAATNELPASWNPVVPLAHLDPVGLISPSAPLLEEQGGTRLRGEQFQEPCRLPRRHLGQRADCLGEVEPVIGEQLELAWCEEGH